MSETIKLSDLQPDAHNANKGSERGTYMIRRSLEKLGAGRSIVLDKNGRIIAGNKTAEAAEDIGLDDVIVVRTDGRKLVAVMREDLDLDDPAGMARELAYADNRTGQVSLEWDAGVLSADIENGVDLSDWFTAFELDEFGVKTGDTEPSDAEPQIDRAEELREQWGVETGQLWRLPSRTPGQEHRLICGDCTDADSVDRLLMGDLINVGFTSPPYAEQREYDAGSGFKPIPPDDYVDWWSGVQGGAKRNMASDGSLFINIKAGSDGLDTYLYVIDLVAAMVRRWGWHFATEFCWERNGVPKNVTQRFKNQFEPVYQFSIGRWKMRPDNVRHYSDNVPRAGGAGVGNTSWANAQGGNGAMFGAAKKRKRGTSDFMSDVQGHAADAGEFIGPGMAYPGNRLPTFAGSHTATGHTAAFPVGLPEFFIKAYSDSGDIIYEPFSGSGTTIIAAENLARQCRAVEISPGYVAVALERYAEAFGIEPELMTDASH